MKDVAPSMSKAKRRRAEAIARLKKGTPDERVLAARLSSCRKGKRCHLSECAVCMRRSHVSEQRVSRSQQSRSISGDRILTIALNAIEVDETSHRPLELDRVSFIAQTIVINGLHRPLLVRNKGGKKSKLVLLAGHYCFAAIKLLGWTEALCKVFVGNNYEARLTSIIDNVARAELRVLDRAEHIEELRKLVRSNGEGGKMPFPHYLSMLIC